jgi:hypothetical protein
VILSCSQCWEMHLDTCYGYIVSDWKGKPQFSQVKMKTLGNESFFSLSSVRVRIGT